MSNNHEFLNSHPNSADQDLLNKITALDPWFYPTQIANIAVMPGMGGAHGAKELVSRTQYREHLIVDAALQRYDFKGKSMLDLGANISYWPSRFVPHGLAELTAIEGRPEVVEQAQLYWSENDFLPMEKVHLSAANVLEDEPWRLLQQQAPFDCTLCAGLLYHLPEYESLLQRMAKVTRDLMIVDTRVVHQQEQLSNQQFDRKFNAIDAVLMKKKPNLIRLMQTIDALGFKPELILPQQQWPDDMPQQDNYSNGSRVTICALRKKS